MYIMLTFYVCVPPCFISHNIGLVDIQNYPFNMDSSNNSSNVPPSKVKKRKINNDDCNAQAEVIVGGSESSEEIMLTMMKQMMSTMFLCKTNLTSWRQRICI